MHVPNSRRQFLSKLTSAALTVATANTAIYVVGSAFKNLDGDLVAGAKVWKDTGNLVPCVKFKFQTVGSACTNPPDVEARGANMGQNKCRDLICN
jgi:hypothetical protein